MRFLIVDDDESIRMYLQSILAPYASCDCAASGKEGLEAFEKALRSGTPYSVVLMDILMLGMDGHQAAESMRAREKELGVGRNDQFRLVMITSLDDDTSVSRAFFNAEAACYIVKPLDKKKVLDEFRQNLII